jgi:hypothetical protein
LLGSLLVIPLGGYAISSINRKINAKLLEHKLTRETTATVKAKKYVRFDENNFSYINEEGHRVEKRPGDEEWRIYYQIDNFDQIDEPARGQLLKAEMERVSKGLSRFDLAVMAEYDTLKEGDKIIIGWKWLGGDTIEIIYARKPSSSGKQ